MQLKIAFIKFCASLAVMASLSPGVWADGGDRNCPERVKPNGTIFTRTNADAYPPDTKHKHTLKNYPQEGGIPFDYVVLRKGYNFDKSGFIFYRIPVGYSYGPEARMNTFMPYDDPMKAVLPPGFDLVAGIGAKFWMPSGRHVERGLLKFYDQVCEYGRPLPSGHEYIVHLYTGPFYVPYDDIPSDEYTSNRKSYIEYHGNLPPIKYGLEVLTKLQGPYKLSRLGIIEENSFAVWISCAMSCTARFFFPQTKMFLILSFEYRRLAHWKESMNMAVKLLNSWHVDLPSHPSEHLLQEEIRKTIKMNEGVRL